ncbi:hypothetical protein ROHU_024534 [Labeo rohita]|uniref:Uncharacterized protein n=1 Tax=Labeo rohita TaxID=84645 RepID=A0A498MN43_LABRO|nr:hypothetical protein ROHU_024534 [Labeo rohita]
MAVTTVTSIVESPIRSLQCPGAPKRILPPNTSVLEPQNGIRLQTQGFNGQNKQGEQELRDALQQQQLKAEKKEASEFVFASTVQKWLCYAPERLGGIARGGKP